MRLLLVAMTALAASTQHTTHGLLSSRRSLATTYPACTAAQSETFTDSLGAVSSGCANATSYDWDGNDDPSDTQRKELCKCTVSAFSVPKCHWTKQDIYDVSVLEHFNFVYNCSSMSGKATPSVTEVDASSYTPAPAPAPATTTVTPTTSTSASSKATETLPDCTVQQLSAFTGALYTASGGCMGGTASSYNWGGNANPTDAQYSEICKCAAVTAFTIPSCSIQKGPDPVVLSVHYNWVTTVQCPTFSPSKAASSSSSSSSSSNVGMIAGIAGGVVVVVLIIAFVLCKRNRKSKHDQPIQQQHNDMDAVRSPVNYQPIGVTPHNKRKSTDHRPSGLSDGARTTISTTNGSLQPSGTGSSGSKGALRMTETATWDDPVITAVRIPYDSIFFGGLLSRGGFGEVYRGSYKGETVAIKQLLPARRKDLAQIEQFLQEVKLVSTFDHERIVKFIGVAWNSLSDACLVVEFMENGDLRSVLTRWDSEPEKRMNGFDQDKVRIALHIAHALVYLHSLQPVMVHRDLKSTNILLDANMDAKLTDFGVSRERADSTMTAGVGSSLWMAPEVMMGNRYDEKADIFSFGVVLSELDTHQLPYFHARVSESGQKIPEAAILQQVMLGRVTVGFTDRADPELVQLGRECVSLDPRERPTTAMVLHRVHQVMQGWHRGMAL